MLGHPRRAGIGRASTASPSSRRRSTRARCGRSRSRARSGSPGVDIPTLREQGVDVEFENWRRSSRPPGITAADRARLDGRDRGDGRARRSGGEALARYRWLDRYLAGEPFDRFVRAEEARVRDVLGKLGFGSRGRGRGRDDGAVSLAGARRAGAGRRRLPCARCDGRARAESEAAPPRRDARRRSCCWRPPSRCTSCCSNGRAS